MSVPVRHRTSTLLPDLTDWFESFPALWGRAVPGAYGIRIEDYKDDGRYVIRAEIPGIDPEKDVDITVESGVLVIRTERREEKKDKQHSEFRYGSFTRSIPLPSGAREDAITASYDNGVLTVTVPVEEAAQEGRRIPIRHD